MRAIVITKPGGPEVLELREVATPEPAPGQVRVRVRACAVNRADLLQRMGMYPPPADVPQDIPGLEIAGEVDAVGSGVVELAKGDRVFGVVGGGAYAEAVVVHARTLAKIPDSLDFTQAAAVPEAFVTAYDAMVLQGGLTAGEVVLVHAVGSGVGTAAVQIARAIGARSIGTARSEPKLARARELGMNEGVVPGAGKSGPEFAAKVREATQGRGVDVVLELVGGNVRSREPRLARREGPPRTGGAARRDASRRRPRHRPAAPSSSVRHGAPRAPARGEDPGGSGAGRSRSRRSSHRALSCPSSTACCRSRRPPKRTPRWPRTRASARWSSRPEPRSGQ